MLEGIIFNEVKEKLFPFEDEVVLLEKLSEMGYISNGLSKTKNGATYVQVVSNPFDGRKFLIPSMGVVYNDVTKKMVVIPNIAAFNSAFPRFLLITDDESFYQRNPEIGHALDLLYGNSVNIFFVFTHFKEDVAKKELEGLLGFNESHMRNPTLWYLLKSYKTYSKINSRLSRSDLILRPLMKLVANILGNKKSLLAMKAREEVVLQNAFYDFVLFSGLFSFEKDNRQRFYSMLENQSSVFIGLFFVSFMMERTHYNLNEYMHYFEESIKPYFKQRLIGILESFENKPLAEFSSNAKSLFFLVKKRGELDDDFLQRVQTGLEITLSKIKNLDDGVLFSKNGFLSKSIKESRDERAERIEAERLEKGDSSLEEDEGIPF